VRVEGWRVDGFGTLSDLRTSGIGPGLTVVFGPNESGKTTLMDFLRGVLVGFPDPRRRLPRHEPVRGGRHGGAVFLVDDGGRRVVVERFVGSRAPLVTADGAGGSAAEELTALLASVDQAVFRSVFAFGLTELQGLGTLAGDELRDLLFSAGVVGAGRSATAVLRTLSDERAKIVRARHSEARANKALRRLQDVDQALRIARDEMRHYPSLDRELDAQAGRVQRCRSELDAQRRRQTQLDKLVTLWPVWQRGQAALAELAGRSPEPLDGTTLQLVPRVAALAAQLSGYEARAERLDELERSRAGLVERLAEQRERLGGRWDEERVRALDTSISAIDAVREYGRRLSRAEVAADLQAARVRDARAAADGARRRLEAIGAEPAYEADAAPLRPTSRGGLRTWRLLLAAAAVACAIAACLGAFHRSIPLVATSVGGLVAAGVALLTVDRSAAAAAAELHDQGIEQRQQSMDADRQRRARLEAASLAFEEADAALERELEELEDAEGVLADTRRRWSAWTGRHGLPQASPDGTREFLEAAAALASRAEAQRRVDGEIERVSATRREYERLVNEVALAAGCPASGHDAPLLVAQLQDRVTAATDEQSAVARLRETVNGCDQQLNEMLGTGPEAEDARRELAGGDLAGWDAEGASLRAQLTQLTAAHEEAVRQHHDLTLRLTSIGDSDALARLGLERSGLVAELECELREWWVLGMARSLVEETLGLYERDRQPVVVARAAELFARVTGGRYVHLVPRGDSSGGRDAGIDVVDAAGRRFDATLLSRGTVEQLYLCLRLAMAEVFAERAVPLPFVLDDVLVNFDPARAEAVAKILAQVAERHQVLLFTCHPQAVALTGAGSGSVGLVELPRPERGDALRVTAEGTAGTLVAAGEGSRDRDSLLG
jgi:uncharacterized protein YhaN